MTASRQSTPPRNLILRLIAVLVGLSLLAFVPSERVLTVTGPLRPAHANVAATLSIDGSRRFQTIDCLGVNASAWAATYSDLTPVMDRITSEMGATCWRVDPFGGSDWLPSLQDLNDDSYRSVYESPRFQAAWTVLEYLYQRRAQVIVSFTGRLPGWASSRDGYDMTPEQADNLATELVSMIDYGRRVRGLPITLVSLMNETDVGGPEGPGVAAPDYAAFASIVLAKLGALGYFDVDLVAPDMGNDTDAPIYVPYVAADPALQQRVRAYAVHTYFTPPDISWTLASAGHTRGFKSVWVTEWGQMLTDGNLESSRQDARDQWGYARETTRSLLTVLSEGANGALAWEAWDNLPYHNLVWSYFGLFNYSEQSPTAGGAYTPKKRFYTNAQVMAHIPPGSRRVQADTTDQNLQVLAFVGPTSSQFTIVGFNPYDRPAYLSVSLANVSAKALQWTETNRAEDLARKPDILVTSNEFSVDVPPDTFFALSTAS